MRIKKRMNENVQFCKSNEKNRLEQVEGILNVDTIGARRTYIA